MKNKDIFNYLNRVKTTESKMEFFPLCKSNHWVPRYPIDVMDSYEQTLWEFFTQTLSWGTSLHSRATFDFLINAKNFSKDRAILDAGAGHKRYEPFFFQSIYLSQEHPTGIAAKKLQGIDYDLVSPIDEEIPLIDNSISAVLSTSVLEHVRFPEKFLKEAYRVLEPGGRIYIHVPFTYPEHEIPYDFQRPTKFGLQAWLKEAGFSKIQVLPASGDVYGANAHVIEAMKREFSERNKNATLETIAPILKYCLDFLHSSTDDYISLESSFPIGWIAVAEKNGDLPISNLVGHKKADILDRISTSL